MAGLRDRVLLLVRFVGGLRRSELAGLDVDHLVDRPRGLVLIIPCSKTNQYGMTADLVVLVLAARPERCPVRAIRAWRDSPGITAGRCFTR